ncbi:E3 ubiquitin-protein ligase RFI2 [Linum grandiflorum]
MGLGNSENNSIVDDDGDGVSGGAGGGGGEGYGNVSVPCSICLEVVTDAAERSWAKLQCGHQFHLDCIGSAFNTKGAMQCPNCRKIEKGQWLFGSGSRPPASEISMEDWAVDEDVYYSVSEVSLGIHYCPFGGGLARFPSSFEDGEFSLNPYHDHVAFPEQAAVTSTGSPHVAYFGSVHPSSSNSSPGLPDASNFNNHWSPQSSLVPSDMPSSYAIPYHIWEHQAPPFNSRIGGGGVDQASFAPNAQRAASRTNVRSQRAGSFVQPFLINQSPGVRAVPPSITPTYQGSNARARDRVQALQEYYQQPQPSNAPQDYAPLISAARRQFNRTRELLQSGGMAASSADPAGFFFVPPGTSPPWNYQEAARTRFPTQEQQQPWFPMNNQHTESGADSGWDNGLDAARPGNRHRRYGLERRL